MSRAEDEADDRWSEDEADDRWSEGERCVGGIWVPVTPKSPVERPLTPPVNKRLPE